jgi:hypothetical protein
VITTVTAGNSRLANSATFINKDSAIQV